MTLYAGWSYVVVEAGPDQAAQWRSNDWRSWRGARPDLLFPADRSWLVSRRPVELGEDATPPGHTAI